MRLREVGNPNDESLVEAIKKTATPLGRAQDLNQLIDKMAKSRIVMLGEASHGTHEFYEWRKAISAELIQNHGFNFIGVEGDWPACWDINKFIQGQSGADSTKTLASFKRWPTWMWANKEVASLADWLKDFNSAQLPNARVGFYGLDVYSLFESMNAVLEQVKAINPFLARRLKARYECFEPFHGDEKSYARSLLQFPEGCLEAVTQNLRDILKQHIGDNILDPIFDAQQNARIVANAEDYYRTMVHGSEDSWNVRDRHMLETLEILLNRSGPQSKAIVWAHNTHIGDYRATDMLAQSQVNIGGLAREKWGAEQVFLVGFGNYRGSVIASHAWDGPTESMITPPARRGSYESAMHKACQSLGVDSFYLTLDGKDPKQEPLTETRGNRAIGVVYHPDHEQFGNYVPTTLTARYDAFLFFDTTKALEPLAQSFDRNEFPETWPVGM